MNADTNMSSDHMHGGGDRKRKRTCASNHKSEVWIHFTKICTTDRSVVYAICHYCDRRYNGDSRNGTSHLRRHKEKCSSNHPGTGNVNGANTACEAGIWAMFLAFKNNGGCDLCWLQIKHPFIFYFCLFYTHTCSFVFQEQNTKEMLLEKPAPFVLLLSS